MKKVIWCWSLKDTNTIFIFRENEEIELDLKNLYSIYSFNDIKFTKEEQELLQSLIPNNLHLKTCKSCKYLLKTIPNKKTMHKCAVTGKDIVLKTKACKEFKKIDYGTKINW